jgi:hypothetical protein
MAFALPCLQDTVVAVRRSGGSLVITSMHPDRYPDSKFSVDPDQVSLEAHFCITAEQTDSAYAAQLRKT